MNYLYKESTISSPVDNILIIGQFILTHHHITLSVYDLGLNLVRRKCFYDKILNIKRINSFSFVILFDNGKIIQSDLHFNPLCLRIVDEMEKIEAHNNYCIAFNQYSLKWFNMSNEGIKDLNFSVLGIFNIKSIFFMENYIPTLIVVSQLKQGCKCYLISLDGTPLVVDEFEVIDNIMTARSIDKYIIFASRNFVQIKYKRDNYIIRLNKNLNSEILVNSLKSSVIECFSYDCKESAQIFLESPFIFARDDLIFILDSNGELFKIKLKLDVMRIFSATISFLKKISNPSSLDFDSKYLAVGSLLHDTVLFEIQSIATTSELEKTSPEPHPENVHNNTDLLNSEVKDRKIDNISSSSNFLKSSQSRTIDFGENFQFIEKARINHIGIVKCFEPEENNSLLITTTSGIFTGKFFLDFDINIKAKVNSKIDRIFIHEKGILALSQASAFLLGTDLSLSSSDFNENLTNEVFFMNFKIHLDNNHRLIFTQNDMEIFFIENVDCWAVGVGKVAFLSKGIFNLLELQSFKIVFVTSQILLFNNQFHNEHISISSELEHIDTLSYRELSEYPIKETVIEMLVIHDFHTFILFRTTKQLYVYQYSVGKLTKVFIPKFIIFGSENHLLFNIFDMVYCRSKHPCFIIFKNGISVIPCSLKISYPVTLDNWIYGLYKGNLIKAKISLDDCIISDKLLLKPIYMFESSNENLKSLKEKKVNSIEIQTDNILEILENGEPRSDELGTTKRKLNSSYSNNNREDKSSPNRDKNDIKRRKILFKPQPVPEDLDVDNDHIPRPLSPNLKNDFEEPNSSRAYYSDESHQRMSYSWIAQEKPGESYNIKPVSFEEELSQKMNDSKIDKEIAESSIKPNYLENTNEIGADETTEPKNLAEEYRNDPMIKFVIVGKGCYVFIIAKYEEFVYNPFIPTVHISDPQTGKTHSEPINKEEAEYKNPFPILRARTLRFTLELRSTDFKIMSSLILEPNEFVCDAKIMFNDYLVICTSFPEGEDKKTKGKLTVYLLTDIVYDPENPHITKKLKFISSETFKDSCLSAVEVRSLIAVSVGTKLMIYEFNINTGLSVMGVNEVSLLTTSLYSTKNFIAISDIFNGVFFFFLRPRDPLKLHLLGKSIPVPDCRFLLGIDYDSPNDENTQLSLLAFDKYGTIHSFTYTPEQSDLKNSNLLIKRAEVVTKTRYPFCYSFAGKINNFESLFFSCNFMTSLMTIHVPRLPILQHYISVYMDDTSGINPRNYLETTDYINVECKSVICERSLLEFFYLKPEHQQRICELLGITFENVIEMMEACLIHHR